MTSIIRFSVMKIWNSFLTSPTLFPLLLQVITEYHGTPKELPAQKEITSQKEEREGKDHSEEPIKIRIGDTTNFMVKSAKCCNPIYGDEIIGYVSRGRGLIIHRVCCDNFYRIPNVAERSVSVVWEEKPIILQKKKSQN